MTNLCTHLRSITFTVATCTYISRAQNIAPWDVVIHSLLMIPSALHRVIVSTKLYFSDLEGTVYEAFEELSECVDWERLEEALESHRSLEAVTIRLVGMNLREAFRAEVEKFNDLVESHLVRVSASGILRLAAPVE